MLDLSCDLLFVVLFAGRDEIDIGRFARMTGETSALVWPILNHYLI